MKYAKHTLLLVVAALAVVSLCVALSRGGGQDLPPVVGRAVDRTVTEQARPPGAGAENLPGDMAAAHSHLDAIEAKASQISEILSAVQRVESDWESGKIEADRYLAQRKEIMGRYLDESP